MLIAGLVVVAATVYAALGRGGQMAAERADYAPLELGPVSATDVALFRPSSAAWGYDMQVTDEALARIAGSIRDRDVRIVALERLVTDLSRITAPVPPGSAPLPHARHRRVPETRPAPESLAAAPTSEAAPPTSEAGPEPERDQPEPQPGSGQPPPPEGSDD